VNTAYFAWTSNLDCIWVSDVAAAHSRNLATNPRAAIAVFDSTQTWGEADRGIQLFGSARRVGRRGAHQAKSTYARRFGRYRGDAVSGYDFYRFRPHRFKLFDEKTLGEGVFVTATVRATGVEWKRTEIYRPRRGT
jgi:uncharacterized protein YhbP (UPF0306 family)